MGESQTISIHRNLGEGIPALTDNFEGFKTSVDKVIADVADIASVQLEVKPEDVTKLLPS
jgi:hypothetical protein